MCPCLAAVQVMGVSLSLITLWFSKLLKHDPSKHPAKYVASWDISALREPTSTDRTGTLRQTQHWFNQHWTTATSVKRLLVFCLFLFVCLCSFDFLKPNTNSVSNNVKRTYWWSEYSWSSEFCRETLGPGIHFRQSPTAVPPSAGLCALQHSKRCPGIPPGAWERAQGINVSSKFPRTQSDQASVGCASRSLIHGGPISLPTGLKGSAANTSVPDTTGLPPGVPCQCPQRLGTESNPQQGLHGSDLFWHIPLLITSQYI